MDLSVFVAQTAAVIYLSVGVGMLVNKKYYIKIFDHVLKDMTAMYLGGFVALIVGFTLITFHNDWVKSWEVIVTILGWLALIKGIMILAFPVTFQNLVKTWIRTKKMNVYAFVVIFFGLVFGYFGFLV